MGTFNRSKDTDILRESIALRLAAAGIETAQHEADQIVDVTQADPELIQAIMQRRLAGEPLGLILGITTFSGLPLHVVPGTLVPRLETELLAQTALSTLTAMQMTGTRIIDMCCGVGNLAITIGYHAPATQIWAVDLTESCIQAAQKNVALYNLGSRIHVLQGDLFEPLQGRELEGTIDMIVCNPPYISTKRLASERAGLLEYEPREAFDAGPYGLSIHQRVVSAALPFLKPGGYLLFEFGEGQARQVRILFERTRAYNEIRMIPDANGNERVAIGQKN